MTGVCPILGLLICYTRAMYARFSFNHHSVRRKIFQYPVTTIVLCCLFFIIASVLYSFVILKLIPPSFALSINIVETPSLTVTLESDTRGEGLNLIIKRGKYPVVGLVPITGTLGCRTGPVHKDIEYIDGLVLRFENDGYNIILRVNNETVEGSDGTRGYIVKISWKAPKDTILQDCFNLGSSLHWYGGPHQSEQMWPIENLSFKRRVATDFNPEPYFLSSDGIFYYFDQKSPLFIDLSYARKHAVCFMAKIESPYSMKRYMNALEYTIGIFVNVKEAHKYAVENYLGKPTAIPDPHMIKYPVWSTWAAYYTYIDHDTVVKFAEDIQLHGFNYSQLEIDDLWEVCYGSLTVDEKKFPKMDKTVAALKKKGFRVTLWVHPFINKGCDPWYTTAVKNQFVVKSESGSVTSSWWNDNGTTAVYIDFTRPEATAWFIDRVRILQKQYGFDGFKFDGGDYSYAPKISVLEGDVRDQPGSITTEYLKAVARFGPLTEVRVAYRTQELPIFLRMRDKSSRWSINNGLKSLVTSLLQLNMNGYPFVLPDMIGGNGYYAEFPTKELFIRWLQASTFMPSLQFSYPPWYFDHETVMLSRKFADLHAQYADQIIAACQRSVLDGTPVNPPIWWISPNDTVALGVADQFLLGDNILVAPVLTQGAVSRDVYLPRGAWLEQGEPSSRLEGVGWLKDYPAPLDTLPFFVKVIPNN